MSETSRAAKDPKERYSSCGCPGCENGPVPLECGMTCPDCISGKHGRWRRHAQLREAAERARSHPN